MPFMGQRRKFRLLCGSWCTCWWARQWLALGEIGEKRISKSWSKPASCGWKQAHRRRSETEANGGWMRARRRERRRLNADWFDKPWRAKRHRGSRASPRSPPRPRRRHRQSPPPRTQIRMIMTRTTLENARAADKAAQRGTIAAVAKTRA